MDKFLTEEGLNLISVLLVLGAAGYCLVGMLWAKLERDDQRWAEENPVGQAEGFKPNVEHIGQVLAGLDSLRQPLPPYRKLDAGHENYPPQDAADLARGTSLNVLVAASMEVAP